MATGYEIYGPVPWRRPVSGTLNTPPAEPALGASYVIGETPTGEWVGRSGHIARWSGEEWKYEAPTTGWRVYDKETKSHRMFGDTAWEDFPAGVSWGQIGGALSEQTDLGLTLSGKAASDHDHDEDYAALDHTHDGGDSDPWTIVKLASPFSTTATTNTAVTDFYFTPAINKTYYVLGCLMLRTATTTVGARPGIAWPTNLTDGSARMEAANSLTASALRSWGAKTTQNAASTGLATTADSHFGGLEALIVTGGTTSGNFQITLASETSGTAVTMRAGSFFMYREI